LEGSVRNSTAFFFKIKDMYAIIIFIMFLFFVIAITLFSNDCRHYNRHKSWYQKYDPSNRNYGSIHICDECVKTLKNKGWKLKRITL
jgi:hypothetical protein